MEILLILVAIICFVLAAIPVRGPWLPIGLAVFAAAHVVTNLIVGVR